MDFNELLALRRTLIENGRSLEVGDDENAIQPNMHFYLLSFNGGRGAPRLTRSGTLRDMTNGVTALGMPRGQRNVRLGIVCWDGDTEPSRHPLHVIGLLHISEQPILLAVQSLDGIVPAPIDERPLRQRQADMARAITE